MKARFSFAHVVAAALGAAVGAPLNSVAATWQHPEATVTIADVYYTLPSFWNVALVPQQPLCLHADGFAIVIAGRDLFIDGVLAYRAKRFDKVYVSYPMGVVANGRTAHVHVRKLLDATTVAACGYW